MKNNFRFCMTSMLVASMLVLGMGCEDDDEEPSKGVDTKTYTLAQLDSSGVSGTVTFAKENDAATKVTIALTGTEAGGSHPAHIHANAASAGGPIVLDFEPVDGTTGKSETMVTALNDGTPITYDELISYNGHVNVHKSVTELAVMIAQGNIGSNAAGTTGNNGSMNNGGGSGNGGY